MKGISGNLEEALGKLGVTLYLWSHGVDKVKENRKVKQNTLSSP